MPCHPTRPAGYPDFETTHDVVLAETVCRVQQQNRPARGDSQGQLVDSPRLPGHDPRREVADRTVVDDTGPILVVDVVPARSIY